MEMSVAEDFAVDVLICGAGAAGLTLAIDLARRGVSFRLIEKMDAPFGGSRGKGIQPRTQEVFEDLGIQQAPHSTLNSYLEKLIYLLLGSFARAGGVKHDAIEVGSE